MTTREQVWLECMKAEIARTPSDDKITTYVADACLKAFDERFPGIHRNQYNPDEKELLEEAQRLRTALELREWSIEVMKKQIKALEEQLVFNERALRPDFKPCSHNVMAPTTDPDGNPGVNCKECGKVMGEVRTK